MEITSMSLAKRFAIFAIFAVFVCIGLLSVDNRHEANRRLSSSNQLMGQGDTILNTRQKVGVCSGVEVKVTKVFGLKNNGDFFSGNDLYLLIHLSLAPDLSPYTPPPCITITEFLSHSNKSNTSA